MDQAKRLKWGAIAFTIFWIGGMLWWSDEYNPVNIIILSVCGALAGYFWYRAMCWSFRRMRVASRRHRHGRKPVSLLRFR